MAGHFARLAIAAAITLAAAGPVYGQDGRTALVNADVIDGRGNPPVPDQTILIADGRIDAIFNSGERPLPEGTRTIDLSGHTVLPGLIEGHVHLTRIADAIDGLREMFSAGITTVRDLGGDARVMKELIAQASAEPGTMPDIVYSAVLYGPQFLADPRSAGSARGLEPGTAPWSRVVTADSDIAEVVANAKATGATGLKLYASIEPDVLRQITEEAERQGMKSWSHSIIFPSTIDHVVRAKPDEVVHAKGFISAGGSDLPDNFREGTRKWIASRDFEGTDPDGARYRRLFAEMVEAGIILQPALLADIAVPERRLGPSPSDSDKERRSRPAWLKEMADWACRITGAAYRAGVTISAGSDTFGNHAFLNRELSRLVECGLTPLDALQAATYNNALAMGMEDEIGSVEEGKRADLVVIEGDPSEKIGHIANVRMVVKNGYVIRTSSD